MESVNEDYERQIRDMACSTAKGFAQSILRNEANAAALKAQEDKTTTEIRRQAQQPTAANARRQQIANDMKAINNAQHYQPPTRSQNPGQPQIANPPALPRLPSGPAIPDSPSDGNIGGAVKFNWGNGTSVQVGGTRNNGTGFLPPITVTPPATTPTPDPAANREMERRTQFGPAPTGTTPQDQAQIEAAARDQQRLRELGEILGSITPPAPPATPAPPRSSHFIWPDHLPGDPPPDAYGPGRKAVSDWNKIFDDIDKGHLPPVHQGGTDAIGPQAPNAADAADHAKDAVQNWDDILRDIDKVPAQPQPGVQSPRPAQ
jgi:hypothetical protein